MAELNSKFETDVVIVGAGICGLLAANTLSAGGYRVIVLDKGRGLGGRLATRRIDEAPYSGVTDGLTLALAVPKYFERLVSSNREESSLRRQGCCVGSLPGVLLLGDKPKCLNFCGDCAPCLPIQWVPNGPPLKF